MTPLADLEPAALQQPGAVRRDGMIKFQCPDCRAEGHDAHQDNAGYFLDSRQFGCAVGGKAHWRGIGKALGVSPRPAPAPPAPPNGHVPPEAAPVAAPLRVPEPALLGIGRDFADLYATYLETPRSFLYFSFLTYFGAVVARKIALRSALTTEPRLFTVLIGESADTRKSTTLRVVDEFFQSLDAPWTVPVLYGVGSAEGIAAELKESPTLLLHFDELKSFVDKAKNDHSVALPMLATLFERDNYDNRVKAERLRVRGASVNLLAACTTDTYATMFDQRFFAIGFLNRLWLVSDRSTPRFSVPLEIPPDAVADLRTRVLTVLERIETVYVRNGLRPVGYDLTPEARTLFHAWYLARSGSLFERRLDTYGHRLMLLLAATSGRHEIDADVAQAVVDLLTYQLDVRRECDPVDAENTIALLEEKIRRALARGALRGRDLKRKCSYHRYGLWMWTSALDNLLKAEELAREPKTDLWWLTVSSSVSSTKTGISANDHG